MFFILEKEHEQNSAAIQALLEEGCKMQDVSEAIKLLHENGGIYFLAMLFV